MNATHGSQVPRATTVPANGRLANGRFAAGNLGGPGNPYARIVAQLRKVILDSITEEDMKEIVLVLKEKAKAGSVAAIKLLCQYVLGKPSPATDPDRLALDDWQKPRKSVRPPAVEQNFTAPFLAKSMVTDERAVRCVTGSEMEPEGAPKTNGDNGDPGNQGAAPKANGENGGCGAPAPKANGQSGAPPGWWDQMVEEVLAEARPASRDRPDGARKRREHAACR